MPILTPTLTLILPPTFSPIPKSILTRKLTPTLTTEFIPRHAPRPAPETFFESEVA